MNSLDWKTVGHPDLTEEELTAIAFLKDQHWTYGTESQINWIKNNIVSGDTHLLGTDPESGELRAYTTIVLLSAIIDGKNETALGIGSVCVDKKIEHSGYGKQLVMQADGFIRQSGYRGLLLCRDELTAFYKKCGWKSVRYKTATVADRSFEKNIMCLDFSFRCSSITINRNF